MSVIMIMVVIVVMRGVVVPMRRVVVAVGGLVAVFAAAESGIPVSGVRIRRRLIPRAFVAAAGAAVPAGLMFTLFDRR